MLYQNTQTKYYLIGAFKIKQVQTLAIILLLICSSNSYLTFSQNNKNQANSKHESSKLAKNLTKKEIISIAKTTLKTQNIVAKIKNKSNDETSTNIITPEIEFPVLTINTEKIIEKVR